MGVLDFKRLENIVDIPKDAKVLLSKPSKEISFQINLKTGV
mgnify:FL=1